MAVRDRETGKYVDPSRFRLFIRNGEKGTKWRWYGGDPAISEDDGDGWFDDFPPIPPGN